MNVAWFSAGVSSAVAIKMAVDELDAIIYIDIEDQHPDTLRFVEDCSDWFGRKIKRLQSRYKSVENVIRNSGGYINGTRGATCSRILKQRERKIWEMQFGGRKKFTYYWGFDFSEVYRAARIERAMPEVRHKFPLIEEELMKEDVHKILRASGVERPEMYELGYHNNNCIGCVKGGMGYWNKIRLDFPDVFIQRARLERLVGASCLSNTYLDELEPDRGRDEGPICNECGIYCERIAI